MYSSECIFQVYLSRYLTVFWGQKSLGFGVNTKKIIMMFGIIIKGILMMLVFIIMTDVGIISICTDIMITDHSHTLISHPLFWYWYGCSHFRKGRQAKFWQTLLRAGKIPKNIFKNLEKYWWDLKKRGGSLLKFREEKSEKKYWKPGTILEISGRTYNLKRILKWVPKKLLIQKNIDWIFQKYLVWKYIKEKIWKKWQKIGESIWKILVLSKFGTYCEERWKVLQSCKVVHLATWQVRGEWKFNGNKTIVNCANSSLAD